jgi:hypothetical protein
MELCSKHLEIKMYCLEVNCVVITSVGIGSMCWVLFFTMKSQVFSVLGLRTVSF